MSDRSTVRWEDPPEHEDRDSEGRYTEVWRDKLNVCKERPGEWAHVRTMPLASARTTGWKLRNGIDLAVPEGRFEFRVSKREAEGGDVGDIYAKYLGPEDDAA